MKGWIQYVMMTANWRLAMKATAVNLRGLKREPRNIRIGNWLFKSVDLVIKLV